MRRIYYLVGIALLFGLQVYMFGDMMFNKNTSFQTMVVPIDNSEPNTLESFENKNAVVLKAGRIETKELSTFQKLFWYTGRLTGGGASTLMLACTFLFLWFAIWKNDPSKKQEDQVSLFITWMAFFIMILYASIRASQHVTKKWVSEISDNKYKLWTEGGEHQLIFWIAIIVVLLANYYDKIIALKKEQEGVI